MLEKESDGFDVLGRRAMACSGWRFLPGMLIMRQKQRPSPRPNGLLLQHRVVGIAFYDVDGEWWPDLTDPATYGCLLFIVRMAWRDRQLWTVPPPEPGDPWECVVYDHEDPLNQMVFNGLSEAGAVVLAFESACNDA